MPKPTTAVPSVDNPIATSAKARSFNKLGLHPILRRDIGSLGFAHPTPIQASLVPAAIEGRDVIGLAPTGTGKTLAFVMPVAHRLLSDPPPILKGPAKRGTRKSGRRVEARSRLRAIVLCPTRELAQQVAEEAKRLVRGSLLKVGAVWGKTSIAPQRDMIAEGLDLLVGTPGRIRELLDEDALSLAFVRHVVVDEADRMLDLGFLPQVEAILDRMPPERQILLLSATFPPMVNSLTEKFLREPLRVEAGGHSRPATHLDQHLFEVEDAFKTSLVLAIVEGGAGGSAKPGNAKRSGVIIFCRTRRRTGWVAGALKARNVSTGLLHGDRSQAQREHDLAEFAAGRLRVLVATDVASRGLHIPTAHTVINYDVPLLPEEYVHRVGRAGHGGGSGESFTFVSPEPEEAGRWKRLVRLTKVELDASPLPDMTPWMRPEDRERFERLLRRKAAALQRELDRAQREELESGEAELIDSRTHGGKKPAVKPVEREPRVKKKTTKRAGKSKAHLRGGHASRPVAKSERPGTGVKRK
jgi:ATP-dependent RNA helicase RhlE